MNTSLYDIKTKEDVLKYIPKWIEEMQIKIANDDMKLIRTVPITVYFKYVSDFKILRYYKLSYEYKIDITRYIPENYVYKKWKNGERYWWFDWEHIAGIGVNKSNDIIVRDREDARRCFNHVSCGLTYFIRQANENYINKEVQTNYQSTIDHLRKIVMDSTDKNVAADLMPFLDHKMAKFKCSNQDERDYDHVGRIGKNKLVIHVDIEEGDTEQIKATEIKL